MIADALSDGQRRLVGDEFDRLIGELVERAPVATVHAVADDLGRPGGTEHERHRTGRHRLDDRDPEVLEAVRVALRVLTEPGAVPVDRRRREQFLARARPAR